MERSGLRFENFYYIKGVKSPRKKKLVWGYFCKDQEVIQQGSGEYTTRIRRLYNKDQQLIQQGSGGYVFRRDYRSFLENFFVFLQILPYQQDFFVIGATIRIGQDMFCLPNAGIFQATLPFCNNL